jgi:hypothetical protein
MQTFAHCSTLALGQYAHGLQLSLNTF